ncbi:hypothetical protein [Nonomuraea recticatena]|uniref:hypothetical protein n=1 Tax=Nonomuraea recticatena TaxID=46178 RepID=UPI003616788C
MSAPVEIRPICGPTVLAAVSPATTPTGPAAHVARMNTASASIARAEVTAR